MILFVLLLASLVVNITLAYWVVSLSRQQTHGPTQPRPTTFCGICGKPFPTREKAIEHVKSAHKAPTDADAGRMVERA